MPRIVCVGECMLELARRNTAWRLGYGGDALNVAVHLARDGHNVAFLTAVGTDLFSDRLRAAWAGEGVDCSLVLADANRHPGLYAITTDAAGERSFCYWRERSAARDMFSHPGIAAVLTAASDADWIFFSLITLAILPVDGRDALFALAGRVRSRGGRVAFDGNFRRQLWPDLDEARSLRERAIACADLGLPTADDEQQLCGRADPDVIAESWSRLGCGEVVVKLGKAGCRLPDGRLIAPREILQPVDTSGAGDAFDAGYLGARIRGALPEDAARAANALAANVITHPGAIPNAVEL